MNFHEVTQPGPQHNVSRIVAAAAVRGLAFQEDPANADAAIPAQPAPASPSGAGTFIGFLTRNVTAEGPTLADITFPGRLDLPTKTGGAASFEPADEVEAEGPDYVLGTGTGRIAADTVAGIALGTPLNFVDGKFAVVQSGFRAEYALAYKALNGADNHVRIRARKL